MEKLGKSMTGGGSGYIPLSKENGKSGWVVYRPRSRHRMVGGDFFSRDVKLMGGVIKLNRTQLYLTFLGLDVLFSGGVGISRSITRPIAGTGASQRSLAAGNFDVTIPTLPRI